MSYKLESIDEEKIVLTKARFEIVRNVIFCCLGLVFLFFGLKMLFVKELNVSIAQSCTMIFFGIMPFVVVRWLYLNHKKHLKHLIFHLKKGYLELHSSSENVQKAYIPFSNFSKLEVTKGAKKTGKNYYYYNYYYIQLHLKDGEKWLLLQAEKLDVNTVNYEKMVAAIHLATETVDLPPPVLSSNLMVSKTDQHDALEWKLSDWTSAVKNAIVAAVLGFVLLLLNFENNLYTVFGLFFGVVFLIFLFSSIYNFRYFIKKREVIFGVSISVLNVCFYERSSTGRMLKSKNVSISNVHSVTNSMTQNMTATNVLLIVQEKEKKLDKNLSTYQKNSEKDKSLNRMYFSNLTYIESLELERWIQERIKARAGVEVL